MSDYDFFTAQLRFVASKTETNDEAVHGMMRLLNGVADQIDVNESFRVDAKNVRMSARALAGVAGFLQQHILPEVIAAKNFTGEKQVRWTIDASMSLMATMMTHAEMTNDEQDIELTLPPPPTPSS